ncbi:uncharacterized protein NPIL_660691 [Nephila pilipes]|uniref:Uncharacterized protein n=1 Tax=Nephila pilipes TaxID=299642 RepID=A0A8X6T938_NEPPI|nr:uncharacterized protein NPIL_660691 [Nephila pilipes]
MLSAKFDLRGWRHNENESTFHRPNVESPLHEEIVSVLGLGWNTGEDTVRYLHKEDVFDSLPVTIRSIPSTTNQQFAPLGILSSVTLRFKILI